MAVVSVAVTVVPEPVVPTAEEPIWVVPSKKTTLPVGAAASDVPLTVAVRTRLEPACTVAGDVVKVVVEVAAVGTTVTVTLPKEYAAYVESPGYIAV